HYSSPPAFDDYFKMLKDLADSNKRNKKVTLIIYDENTARKARLEQFGQDWEKIRTSNKFENYYSARSISDKPEDKEKFFEDFEKRERKLKCEIAGYKGITIKEVSETLPLFFWIVDKRQAGFSFYTYGDEAKETSFESIDASLINILLESEKAITFKAKEFNRTICQ
ncbi:MAG TPA: hypothetical protein VK400_20350, partial [Pyrinomonadaceae bacterium]|nr:hypothetical protein [Pyrinomonadaceae bacterium]